MKKIKGNDLQGRAKHRHRALFWGLLAVPVVLIATGDVAHADDFNVGIHVSNPLIVSVHGDLMLYGQDGGDEMGSHHDGVIVSAEAGIGGGKAGVGFGSYGFLILSGKAMAMRTWLTDFTILRDTTLFGGEVEVGIIPFMLRVGGYWNYTDRRFGVVTVSIGLATGMHSF